MQNKMYCTGLLVNAFLHIHCQILQAMFLYLIVYTKGCCECTVYVGLYIDCVCVCVCTFHTGDKYFIKRIYA
jgi:hypothetical protein